MMNIAIELRKETDRHLAKIAELRGALLKQVEELPDNPRIKRISQNTSVMRSSDLFASGNWTARYHNFRVQYRFIVNLIEASNTIDLRRKLLETIRHGRLHVKPEGCSRSEWVQLHPDVVKNLKHLLVG